MAGNFLKAKQKKQGQQKWCQLTTVCKMLAKPRHLQETTRPTFSINLCLLFLGHGREGVLKQ